MRWVLSLFLCLLTLSGLCQNTQSLLWKISGNDLKKPSYLFGTIHAIPQSKFFINQEIITSFLDSDVIVLETGLDAKDSNSFNVTDISLANGQTLKELYRKNNYQFLEKYFIDTLHGSVKNLITFKPIFLIGVISSRWYKNYVGYESMFINKANENQKKIIGLDDSRDLLNLFNQVPIKEQASILLNTIKNRKRDSLNYNKTLQLYLKQDVDQLSRELNTQFKKYPRYFDTFFNKRNDKWVYKINEIVKSKSCFIAIGAGHLGGASGLVARLRKIGYKVEPL